MRILEHLAAADSPAGIARRLGLPRQQVGYHLRKLERAGLVELVEERRQGNCIERATARSYVISPAALVKLGGAPERRRDRFSNGSLVSLAARAIRDLAVLCGHGQGRQTPLHDGPGGRGADRIGGCRRRLCAAVGAADGQVSR